MSTLVAQFPRPLSQQQLDLSHRVLVRVHHGKTTNVGYILAALGHIFAN